MIVILEATAQDRKEAVFRKVEEPVLWASVLNKSLPGSSQLPLMSFI